MPTLMTAISKLRALPLVIGLAMGLGSLLTSPVAADVRLPNVLSSHMVVQRQKPVNIWGWADAGEKVTIMFSGQSVSTTAGKDGRWSVQLKAMEANAKPQTLTVKGNNTIELKNLLIGEVWLCSGQSNMEWPMTRTTHGKAEIPKANHPDIRLFNVPAHISKKTPQDNAPGSWVACSPKTVAGFSGVGYHFGQSLKQELKIPIGLIGSNWGGTMIEPWTPKVGLDQVPALKGKGGNGGIYNGMIHPLAPFTFRGILWYQGESNCLAGDTSIYTDRTVALVKGWRQVFKQDDLPFYFVQIAPFTYVKAFKKRNKNLTELSLPEFWEAQTACMKALPNCGMVVITDITGNVRNIHPGNKLDVGRRLARWALAKDYGRQDLVHSGPIYKSSKAKGNKITLSFEHVGSGLKSLDGKPLTHFTVAGTDKTFHPAKAVVVGDTIEVTSAKVAKPVAARFGWHEIAVGNFGNKEGLPASPFRTDKW